MIHERDAYVPIYDRETQMAVGDWEGEGNVPNGRVIVPHEPIGKVSVSGVSEKPHVSSVPLEVAPEIAP